MENHDIEEKILGSFNKDINPKLRHVLIRLYNAYNNPISIKEPKKNLIQIEESYDKITKKTKNIYKEYKNIIDINNYDNVNNDNKIKKINGFNKNKYNFSKNINEDFSIEILEYYVMLTDCINNYDNENASIKKKTIQLLTEMEILLNLPVTYPSQIENSIDDLMKIFDKGKKEGVSFVKRNNLGNR